MELASRHMRSRARELRRRQTPEEILLWSAVRSSKLGVRMHRQHPIGHVVVDFYCPSVKVAVELDGAYHDWRQDELRDAELLLTRNVIVVRFANAEVRDNLDAVVDEIRAVIARRMTPSPTWERARREAPG